MEKTQKSGERTILDYKTRKTITMNKSEKTRLEIESRGNLQVSNNKILIIVRSKRI